VSEEEDDDDDEEEEDDEDDEEEKEVEQEDSMAMDQRKRMENEDQEDESDNGIEQNEEEREEVIEAIEAIEEDKESEEQQKEGEEEDEERNALIIVEEGMQQQQQEEKQGGAMEIEIIENPAEQTLEQKLAKATRKVHKWMAGIGPNDIEGTIGEWDKLSLLKMVEMADMEIREHPQKSILILIYTFCNLFIYFNLFQTQFVASLAQMCHPQMFATNRRGKKT
jgi:hypothetical protein